MAELLIKAVDATHPDPDLDRRGCYKRGDVVEVRPDGAKYGACECLPRFLVIRVPGAVDELRHLMEPEYENALRFDDEKMESRIDQEIKTCRRYNFDIDANVGADRIAQIKAADWLVDVHDKAKIKDKLGEL